MENRLDIRTSIQDFFFIFRMLGDFLFGNYKDMTLTSFVLISASILYLACPVDLVCDIIPFVGLLDDATVFAIVYKLVKENVKEYKVWLQNRV